MIKIAGDVTLTKSSDLWFLEQSTRNIQLQTSVKLGLDSSGGANHFRFFQYYLNLCFSSQGIFCEIYLVWETRAPKSKDEHRQVIRLSTITCRLTEYEKQRFFFFLDFPALMRGLVIKGIDHSQLKIPSLSTYIHVQYKGYIHKDGKAP